MNRRSTTMNGTNGLLAVPAALALALVQPAAAQSEVKLDGTVRDFLSAHPDFGVVAISDTGHHAGTVDTALPLTNLPAFAPTGFRVATQWRDENANPIAPHLASVGVLRLSDTPSFAAGAFMDSWDPSLGPYGGANVGPPPAVIEGLAMPSVSFPTDMPPTVGNYVASGMVTLSGDLHCRRFDTQANTVIQIDGAVRILADQTFRLQQLSSIVLLPGATLELYVVQSMTVEQGSTINMNTWDPSRCEIYCTGNQVNIHQGSSVCATLVAPNATLSLQQDDHFYGSFTGDTMQLEQNTGLHAVADFMDACGAPLADTPGTASGPGDGGITDASTFDQWYRDILGVNQSIVHTITLVDNGTGIYEYADNDFHPVDGLLLGNEGQPHNDNFTYTVGARFVFSACDGQFLQVQGGDGLWVFIDDQLAIDLGGVDSGQRQYVDLDRLDLTDGETYELRIFYANRNSGGADLSIVTNLELIPDGTRPTITGTLD